MVGLDSIIGFIIVGIMWGTSDAFMEVGSKNSEQKNTLSQDPSLDLEKGLDKSKKDLSWEKRREKKKKDKKRKEKKIERKRFKKLKRIFKKKIRLNSSGKKRSSKDSLEETNIIQEHNKEEIFLQME